MAKISLLRFRVVNYRSCKDAEICFSPDITALIGPNGSGKTNILQALMLFGQPESGRAAKEKRSQQCRVEVDFIRSKKLIQYRAVLTYRSNSDNTDDALSFNEHWNLSGERGGPKRNWVSGRALQEADQKHSGRVYFSIPSGRRLEKLRTSEISKAVKLSSSRAREIARYLPIVKELSKFSGEIKYYSASHFTNPALCPTSFEIDEDKQLRDEYGSRSFQHTKLLHDLYLLATTRQGTYDLFLSLVDKRGVGLISGLSWRAVPVLSETHEVRSGGKIERKKKKRVIVIPTVKIGSAKLSFNQLSEGTFRALALIFYVVSDRNSIIVIEEPEVCVHHGLLSSVVGILKEFARTKQIIFSTHSEAVVDSLKPEQLRLVEYLPRRGTVVDEVVTRFSDSQVVALKEYLATAGNLGELWRSGGLQKDA